MCKGIIKWSAINWTLEMTAVSRLSGGQLPLQGPQEFSLFFQDKDFETQENSGSSQSS